MKCLVFVELADGIPTQDALGVLSRLVDLGLNPAVALLDDVVATAAEEVLRHGAGRIYVAQDARFAEVPIEPRVSHLERLCREEGFDTVLFAASSQGVEIAARLAARLEAGIIWNISKIDLRGEELRVWRSALADAALAEMEWKTPFRVGLARQRAFEPLPLTATPHSVIAELTCVESYFAGTRIVARSPATSAPAIASAEIVVSGGRGLGSPENLALVRDLAEVLGGAAGVSLPLVDMGWAPRSMQVGQTGVQVQPRLYIACGISGQFQHKIGMERSGFIIAINTDENAPIMSFCDLAVIGDARQILPELIALVKNETGEFTCL